MGVLLEEHLGKDTSSWSAGSHGAVVRFARRAGESVQRRPDSVVSVRGGLRAVLPDEAMLVAYEVPSARDPLRWHHAIAFCLPDEAARGAGRTTLTELGPDHETLRRQDDGGVLFDLGLGTPTTDVLVRTCDPEMLAVLRAAEGRDVLADDLLATITARAPHVVAVTAGGRMEVLAPGDGAGVRLRPSRLRVPPRPAPQVPIPEGWTTVLRLHPANPASEPDGRPVPFDPDRHAAFQSLLAEHGDPVLGVLAADVSDAVRALRGPETMTLPDDPAGRAVVAVTLRHLAFTDGTSGTLAAWRGHLGPTPELADPDED